MNAAAIGAGPINSDGRDAADNLTSLFISGEYHALIVGNDDYQDDSGVWDNLEVATNNAKIIAKILKSEYGFNNITLLLNSSRSDFLNALIDISELAQSNNDNVLIYYAGHCYLKNTTKRGYWIPSDAVGEDYSTYLRNSTFRDEINIIASRALHTLVISDSCFIETLMGTQSRTDSKTFKNRPNYNKIAAKKSVQIFTAGGTEFGDDSYLDSGYSPFTYFLVSKLLSNKKELLFLNELVSSVTSAVNNDLDLEQSPKNGVLLGTGDKFGQFVFKRKPDSHMDTENVKINSAFVDDFDEESVNFNKPKNNDPNAQQLDSMKEFVIPAHRL